MRSNASPQLVRGGPWERLSLPSGWEAEVEAVSKMRSFLVMSALAASHPKGNLHKHLRGLDFVRSGDAPAGAPVSRGACVLKRRRPGKPGNASVKSQLQRGVLKRLSSRLTGLHRGQDACSVRTQETARRKRR